jgi:hypothetical protein
MLRYSPIAYVKTFKSFLNKTIRCNSILKTNYILVKLPKNTTILVHKVPRKCAKLGLLTARLGAKNNKFDVIFYQFPDYLERTFLHNRTDGSEKDDGVSHFLPPVTVFNMGPPEACGGHVLALFCFFFFK